MLILVVVLAMEEAGMLKTMLLDHLSTILYLQVLSLGTLVLTKVCIRVGYS